MKQKILLLLFAIIMIDSGKIHDPPPTLVFNWGDIDPNVKIWNCSNVNTNNTIVNIREAEHNYWDWEDTVRVRTKIKSKHKK